MYFLGVHEMLACEYFHDGETLHGPTRITITDGLVSGIEPHAGSCDTHVIAPGLVDLQVNGWDNVDVSRCSDADIIEMGHALCARGTTSWLATVISAPLDEMASRLNHLHSLVASGKVPGLIGLHSEGPFLGGAPGAHRRRHIVDIDLGWIDALPPSLRLLTMAPERTGAAEAIKRLVARGVTVSLGHSTPARHEFESAVRAGASMVTHLFNGMSGIHHREGGLALWALNSPEVALGLIGDLVHVSPDVVTLAFASPPHGRVCLVSDSVAWNSPWARDRGLRIVDGAPRLSDGTIAGSSTSLAECVRKAVSFAGIGTASAIAAATSTPAKVIGASSPGRLTIGGMASLILLDTDLHVVGTRARLPSTRA